MKSKLPLFLSTLALVVATVVLVRSTRQRGDAQALADIQEGVADVSSQLETLSRKVDLVRTAPPIALNVPQGAGKEAEGLQAAFAHFSERLVALEQQLINLGDRAAATPRQRNDRKPTADAIKAAHALVMDRNAPKEQRAEALNALRLANQRSPEVAVAMADMLSDPNVDEQTKTSVVRDLEGINSPELKRPLLSILEQAKDPRAKAEAVETLQTFYDDPEVMAAVTRARDSDPNGAVRREAARRLAEWQSGERRR